MSVASDKKRTIGIHSPSTVMANFILISLIHLIKSIKNTKDFKEHKFQNSRQVLCDLSNHATNHYTRRPNLTV